MLKTLADISIAVHPGQKQGGDFFCFEMEIFSSKKKTFLSSMQNGIKHE